MFKNLAASSCRFNLRQSMERLRAKLGNLDIKEINAGNEISAVMTDLSLLMGNWIAEADGSPPEKVIRDFNEYLFSGKYGINHIKVLAYAAAYMDDESIKDFSSLITYYDKNLGKEDDSFQKMRAIVRFFVEVMFNGFNHPKSKCTDIFANNFKKEFAAQWYIDIE